jgi:hypothetical protein
MLNEGNQIHNLISSSGSGSTSKKLRFRFRLRFHNTDLMTHYLFDNIFFSIATESPGRIRILILNKIDLPDP